LKAGSKNQFEPAREECNGPCHSDVQNAEGCRRFRQAYFEIHVPLAKKIPGLKKFEVSQGPVGTPAGPSGFHLVATLYFDNLAAIQAGFGSAEGKAAAADLPKCGGADMILFDTREV
jgi:uncharacterized protein (TIGR02118 family)